METEPNEKKPMQEQALMDLRHFGISGERKTLRTSTVVNEVSSKKLQFID